MTETQEGPSSVRLMRLRYPGKCDCGAEVDAGTRAGWDTERRAVVCPTCLKEDGEANAQEVAQPMAEPEPRQSLQERAEQDAGASLAAEYERRMARREERVRQRLPRIGGLLLKIFDEAPSTRAFKKGADGERAAIKRLLNDSGPDALFLVNRRLGPGRRDGDIDVLAVTPAGVLVIDVKRYANAKVRVERHGGLFSERRDVLMVRGRDSSRLLDGLDKQTAAVTETVARGPVPNISVAGALCFVDADLPLFGQLRARGYVVDTPKGIAKNLRETSGALTGPEVEAIADHLDGALPPAV